MTLINSKYMHLKFFVRYFQYIQFDSFNFWPYTKRHQERVKHSLSEWNPTQQQVCLHMCLSGDVLLSGTCDIFFSHFIQNFHVFPVKFSILSSPSCLYLTQERQMQWSEQNLTS